MQMNAGSIAGQFGKTCKQFAKKFLDSGVIHVVASDAHEPSHRNYEVLKRAENYIKENFDEEYTELLFVKNPQSILESKPVKFFKIDSENLKLNSIKYFINKLRISKH
jgi:protein-tyrosine phosphatase